MRATLALVVLVAQCCIGCGVKVRHVQGPEVAVKQTPRGPSTAYYPEPRPAECERFKLHGVRLGDSSSEVRSLLGQPVRRGSTKATYSVDGGNLTVVYHKNTAVELEAHFFPGQVSYGSVMESAVDSYGLPTRGMVEPSPGYDRAVMTWLEEICNTYVVVFRTHLNGPTIDGDALVVQIQSLVGRKREGDATAAFE